MSINVLMVDDQVIIRQGLRLVLEQQEDIKVVAEVSTGQEALDLMETVKPDVILMDITMPRLNGIETTKKILAEHPGVNILALSALCDIDFLMDMLKAGVRGYLFKTGVAGELVDAVRIVNTGQQYFCPKIAGMVINEYISKSMAKTTPTPKNKLTSKDLALVKLLAENKSNKEAAHLLNVSVKTVDARRRSIMEKLGITGIAELTKYAICEGITTIDD